MTDIPDRPKNAAEYRDMTISVIEMYPIPGDAPIELIQLLYAWGMLPEIEKDPHLGKGDHATLLRCRELLKGIIDLRAFKESIGDI